jgi:hypothetical protein
VAEHRDEGPGENGPPVPRDLPDQQAHDGEDLWEVGAGGAQGDTVDTTEAAPSDVPSDESGGAADVPDTVGNGQAGRPAFGCRPPRAPGTGRVLRLTPPSADLPALHGLRPLSRPLPHAEQELLQHLRGRVVRLPAELRAGAGAVHEGEPEDRVEEVRGGGQ